MAPPSLQLLLVAVEGRRWTWAPSIKPHVGKQRLCMRENPFMVTTNTISQRLHLSGPAIQLPGALDA